MSGRASSWIFGLLGLLASGVWPARVAAQAQNFCCRDPQPPHLLSLCSPVASSLSTVIIPEGLAIIFEAPPREATSLLSPLQAAACDSASGCPWGVAEGDTVPAVDVWVSGSYLGVVDQRLEVAILQIGDNADSGVVGTDVIRVAWSSIFSPQARSEIVLDPSNAGTPLPFVIIPAPGAAPDTSVVPGVRVTFRRGSVVKPRWRLVFDVEDFEGFHVWRWASDPNQEPRVVGTYSKVANVARPGETWISEDGTPTARRFGFLDRFVIDGNVYHYALTTYDQGFDRIRGGSLGGVPFDSPLPHEGCPSQLRVDFLRPPPTTFEPVQAVPNPYRQVDCDRADPLSTCTVRFIRMPSRGTLRIYTLAGDLVQEFNHPEDADTQDPPGTIRWDTANAAGQEVASGVYIYKIVDLNSGQESFGRLAIIR